MQSGRKLLFGALLVAVVAATSATAFARSSDPSQISFAAVSAPASFAAAPPANDNWANAAAIIGASGTTTGTNIDATDEATERLDVDIADAPAASTTGKTVWWKWVAPADGNYVFSTFGSELTDTVIGIYTGTSVATLTELNASDDSDEILQSRVALDAVHGTTYSIQVGSYQGLSEDSIKLTWNANPVANDSFGHPTALPVSSGTTTNTNAGATLELHEPSNDLQLDSSVWYSWAPGNGDAQVTLDTGFDDALGWVAVYSGTALTSLTGLDRKTGSPPLTLSFPAVAGTTYRIQVGTVRGGVPEAFTLERALRVVPGAPTLDVANPGDGTVHLGWRAPEQHGASAVTGYRIYRGTSSGGETELTPAGNVTSFDDGSAVNGTTYFYQVSAINSSGEGARSDELTATPVGSPAPGERTNPENPTTVVPRPATPDPPNTMVRPSKPPKH